MRTDDRLYVGPRADDTPIGTELCEPSRRRKLMSGDSALIVTPKSSKQRKAQGKQKSLKLLDQLSDKVDRSTRQREERRAKRRSK